MMDHGEQIEIAVLAATDDSSGHAPQSSGGEARFCPDCGKEGTGAYCSDCGEMMEPRLPPVRHYLKEVFHEFVAFDSRFVRTIPALLFKPGFLTCEYVAGRRKRYLLPSRLYVLIAFVSFFALGSFLHKQLAKATIGGNQSSSIVAKSSDGKPLDLETARHSADELLRLSIEVSPYVLLLGSTPVFSLILFFLYRKTKKRYVEHLVFSLHFYAFSLILLIPTAVVGYLYLFLLGVLLFVIYLYAALRRVYLDRGVPLIARTLACVFAYVSIAGVAVGVTITIAALLGWAFGDFSTHGFYIETK